MTCPKCKRHCASLVRNGDGLACTRCAGVRGRPKHCERCFSRVRGLRLVLGEYRCPECQGAREWSR